MEQFGNRLFNRILQQRPIAMPKNHHKVKKSSYKIGCCCKWGSFPVSASFALVKETRANLPIYLGPPPTSARSSLKDSVRECLSHSSDIIFRHLEDRVFAVPISGNVHILQFVWQEIVCQLLFLCRRETSQKTTKKITAIYREPPTPCCRTCITDVCILMVLAPYVNINWNDGI